MPASNLQRHKDELEGHLGIENHLDDPVVQTYLIHEDEMPDWFLLYRSLWDILFQLPKNY